MLKPPACSLVDRGRLAKSVRPLQFDNLRRGGCAACPAISQVGVRISRSAAASMHPPSANPSDFPPAAIQVEQPAVPPQTLKQQVGKPQSRLRLLSLVAVALTMLVAVRVIRPTDAIVGAGPAVGLSAPAIELTAFCDGNSDLLDVQLVAATSETGNAGTMNDVESIAFDQCRVCLVHFWGTWCGPCRDELPELAQIYEELENNPEFRFLSVTCEGFDDHSLATLQSRTNLFYETHNLRLPTYADPSHTARERFLRLMQRSSMAYPTTILIDRDGVIRATWVGVPPGGADTIRKRVLKVLNE